MVIVSLFAPARMNRTTNIVVSLTYLASVVASIVGETWIYYILGSVVEVMLLLATARVTWSLAEDAPPSDNNQPTGEPTITQDTGG